MVAGKDFGDARFFFFWWGERESFDVYGVVVVARHDLLVPVAEQGPVLLAVKHAANVPAIRSFFDPPGTAVIVVLAVVAVLLDLLPSVVHIVLFRAPAMRIEAVPALVPVLEPQR